MEFLCILISLLISGAVFIGIPFSIYGNWLDTKIALKKQFDGDATLGIIYTMICLLFALVILVILCAFNNSVWHIDYWTTEGLWNK